MKTESQRPDRNRVNTTAANNISPLQSRVGTLIIKASERPGTAEEARSESVKLLRLMGTPIGSCPRRSQTPERFERGRVFQANHCSTLRLNRPTRTQSLRSWCCGLHFPQTELFFRRGQLRPLLLQHQRRISKMS